MMRYYKFAVIIREGSDEFWEELDGDGCKEVTELIKDAIKEEFPMIEDDDIKLTEYFWSE